MNTKCDNCRYEGKLYSYYSRRLDTRLQICFNCYKFYTMLRTFTDNIASAIRNGYFL